MRLPTAIGGEGYLASNRAVRNRGDGIRVEGELFTVTLGKAVDNRGEGDAFAGTDVTIHRVRSAFNDVCGIVEGPSCMVSRLRSPPGPVVCLRTGGGMGLPALVSLARADARTGLRPRARTAS